MVCRFVGLWFVGLFFCWFACFVVWEFVKKHVWKLFQNPSNIYPEWTQIGFKSIENQTQIDENLVLGRLGTILDRGSRQGSSRDVPPGSAG
jgi:hypothetical protein